MHLSLNLLVSGFLHVAQEQGGGALRMCRSSGIFAKADKPCNHEVGASISFIILLLAVRAQA
jgi:hypothetical protein